MSTKNNSTIVKEPPTESNVTPINLIPNEMKITKQKSREELEQQLDGIVAQFKQFEEELQQQAVRKHTEAVGMTQTTSTALDAYTNTDPIVVTGMEKGTHMSTDRLRSSSSKRQIQPGDRITAGYSKRSHKLEPSLKIKRPSTSILKRNPKLHKRPQKFDKHGRPLVE